MWIPVTYLLFTDYYLNSEMVNVWKWMMFSDDFLADIFVYTHQLVVHSYFFIPISALVGLLNV